MMCSRKAIVEAVFTDDLSEPIVDERQVMPHHFWRGGHIVTA